MDTLKPSSQSFQPHGGVWVLVIVLIILTLGLSVTVVWMAIVSSQAWELGELENGGIEELENDEEGEDASSPDAEEVDDATASDGGETPANEPSSETGDGDASTIGAAFSRVVSLDGSGPLNTTPIHKAFQAGPVSNQCQHVTSADDGNPADGVRVEQVTAVSFAPSGSAFRKAVKSVLDQYEPSLAQLCRAQDATIYFTASDVDEQIGHAYHWDGTYLQHYQPVGDINDGVGMFTDLVPSGPLLVTGGGDGSEDGGSQWWTYYVLDRATLATHMVEKCSLVSVGSTRDDEPASEETITCSVWYNGEVN